MMTQSRKGKVTFTRPFVLGAFGGMFPSGDYELEWERDILDGMLPDCLRTSVLVPLHVGCGRPGLTQKLTVAWHDLETALAGDLASQERPVVPYLEGMLSESIIRLVMLSDDVSEHKVRGVVAMARAHKEGPFIGIAPELRARVSWPAFRMGSRLATELDRAAADRQAVERGENEGMALSPA